MLIKNPIMMNDIDIVLTRTVNILTSNHLVKLKCFEQLGPGHLQISCTTLLHIKPEIVVFFRL